MGRDQVNRGLQATVALITRKAASAAMADRVIRLRSGQIVEERRNATRATPADLQW